MRKLNMRIATRYRNMDIAITLITYIVPELVSMKVMQSVMETGEVEQKLITQDSWDVFFVTLLLPTKLATR